MSMPPGMDMRTGDVETVMGNDLDMNAMPGPSMPMFPKQEMASQRFEQLSKTDGTANTEHDRSNSMPPCTNGACSKISASQSPPGGDCSQFYSQHWLTITLRTFAKLSDGSPLMGPGISPPKLLTANRVITTLRI